MCCGLFKIGKHHFEARSRPFFGVRRLAAIAVSWPGVIDECGNLVPSEIITAARLRNIALVWGPHETLGWTAFSIGKGAILLSSSSSDQAARAAEIEAIQENGASDGHVVFPAGAQLPGGKDVSADLMRDDVTTFLDRFAPVPQKFTGVGSVHWVKGRMESMGSLSDAFVSLCIVANTLGMACEHFEGTIDMDCDDNIRCPNNIVIMSEEWMVLLNMSNYMFGVVFTIEAGLKLCAMGWWRYMGERTNQVDFFLVVVSDADMAMSFFAASFFSISFLRIVRLLRVLRLVNRFRRIRMLIIKVGASLSSVLTVLTIFFCCLGIWGLAGMQLFMCPVRPRLHSNCVLSPSVPRSRAQHVFDRDRRRLDEHLRRLFRAVHFLWAASAGDGGLGGRAVVRHIQQRVLAPHGLPTLPQLRLWTQAQLQHILPRLCHNDGDSAGLVLGAAALSRNAILSHAGRCRRVLHSSVCVVYVRALHAVSGYPSRKL